LPHYDIILFLGIYHKLKEQTSDEAIKQLIRHLIARVAQYIAVRTTMIEELGMILMQSGLRKVHFSALSSIVGPVEIWRWS
jgi:hypothetical protein